MAETQSAEEFELELVNLCHEFEQEWANHNGAKLKRYLKRVSRNHRGELFKVLVEIDLEKKRKSGIVIDPEDYSDYGAGAVKYVNRLVNASIDSSFGVTSSSNSSANADNEIANYFKSDRIGPYVLVEQIGEGGMGQVWKAEQTSPVRRMVALKLIKPKIGSAETVARFEAERQALAMMAHPNIAKIFDAGTAEDGSPYFVMELVEGTPLHHFLASRNAPVSERLEVFLSICDAVQHAHQKGVIHRDLKPSNILVHLQDGKPAAKVIDFGLAKALDQTDKLTEQTMLTEYGNLIGTIQYMSPEQASLDGIEPDARSDIFSLGVILYELLVGEPPINKQVVKNHGILQVLEMIRSQTPDRPSKKVESFEKSDQKRLKKLGSHSSKMKADLRADLDWIVMKALEIPVDRRYQSASELADDIRNYIAGEPVRARPPSTTYKISKLAQKNKSLVAVAILFIASLITALVAFVALMDSTNLSKGKSENTGNTSGPKDSGASKILDGSNSNSKGSGDSNTAATLKNEVELVKARSNYQLANARWELHDVAGARRFLSKIPTDYRGLEWYLSQKQFEGSDFTLYGHADGVNCVKFSPGGDLIASGGSDGTIHIWDAITGKKLHEFSEHKKAITDIHFDAEGNTIVAGSTNGWIYAWDIKTGEQLVSSRSRNQKGITSICLSPNGKITASGGADNSVYLSSLSERRGERVKHSDPRSRGPGSVSDVEFSPDNQRFVSVGRFGEIAIWNFDAVWNAKQSEPALRIDAEPATRHALSFHPNGSMFARTSSAGIKLLESATGETTRTLPLQTGQATSVAYSSDGMFVAAGTDIGLIQIWDASTGEKLKTMYGHCQPVTDLEFSPDGRRLTSSSEDSMVKVWSIGESNNLRSFPACSSAIKSYYLSNNGETLITGGDDGTIWRCHLPSFNDAKHLHAKAHAGPVNCIAVSNDENFIATAGADGTVKIWTYRTLQPVKTLAKDLGSVRSVCFSNNGKYLACDGKPRRLHVYELQSGKLIQTLVAGAPKRTTEFKGTTVMYGPGSVKKLLFNRSDTMLISYGNELKIWDPLSGKQVKTLTGVRNNIRFMKLNPDNPNELVAGGFGKGMDDREWIKFWDLETGKETKTLTVASRSVISVNNGINFGLFFSASAPESGQTTSPCTFKIWDINDGSELAAINHTCRGYIDAAVCLNGEAILLVDKKSPLVTIVDAPQVDYSFLLTAHNDPVTKLFMDPDKPILYSEDNAGTQFVWDIASKTLLSDAVWKTVDDGSNVSADGRWLAVASGSDILLVDQQTWNSLKMTDWRKIKSSISPEWHRQQVNRASKSNNHFAAAFHIAVLCENEPENSLIHQSTLRNVVQLIKDQRPTDIERDGDTPAHNEIDIPAIARKVLVDPGELLLDGKPVPVDDDGTITVSESYDDFQAYFDQMKVAGYVPKEFNITFDDATKGKSITATFQREQIAGWEMRTRLTMKELEAKNQQWEQKGGQLVFQQQYDEDGTTYFGAIWKQK